MRIVSNAGSDRLIDLARAALGPGRTVDLMSPAFSLFAFRELLEDLESVESARLVLGSADASLALLGGDADRSSRNRLETRWVAAQAVEWLGSRVQVRRPAAGVPQAALVVRDARSEPSVGVLGSFAFSTDGLGITPGNPMSVIQASESSAEAGQLAHWFDTAWAGLADGPDARSGLIALVQQLAEHRAPAEVYARILQQVLGNENALGEDQVVNAATGIRDTVVWRKLYRFQRDGVVGAIDKINRFGGCIIADSVGLGKTFEALAVIKYHELRNDRVLVLCPKRLRDNWTLYAANDRRNVLAADRFNYDVLNHTDLSRDRGLSGDIDLANINWGNYDLVVIDESHNFRNKGNPKQGGETRYDRLMQRIIQQGVRTRVLMLSATPVNNRMADLRNQIVFATEGDDTALRHQGISSIDSTTRLAQQRFNSWLKLEDAKRTPARLIEMIGFDYFTMLDQLTIARSRKHIEKYYGTEETGRFPERLKPINIKPDVDLAGDFRSIREVNNEIRRLHLASYTPLSYVLPGKLAAYDKKYSTEVAGGSKGVWRQVDREKSLINLMRVNLLKRMESSVSSFTQTLARQLQGIDELLARIESGGDEIEDIDIADVDIDDPAIETLLVGGKTKVLLTDVDKVRWKQDLHEDRNRIQDLLIEAQRVGADRDAKLAALRAVLSEKCAAPINAGNRKVIVFTHFADTAKYLYEHLAPWAKTNLGVESALVTGGGGNQVSADGMARDLASVLTAFSPRSKERPADLAAEGEIDLLIATDCISEGQNLQDCDWLINYDIHWNPVRIIQRFGRIDRIGSPNDRIQLVNFWPNIELEEYINLEQRVSGKMVLLDVSATGEENLIEAQSGNPMNDLEYRRKQLLQLQDAVVDLEDLSSGVSIADLTLTDFRIDLAEFERAHPEALDSFPLGVSAVVGELEADLPPGIVFCVRAEGEKGEQSFGPGYPLAPFALVHVGDDGAVQLTHLHAKQVLDHLKLACAERNEPDPDLERRYDRTTRAGRDMRDARRLLAATITSIVGKGEERSVASLFSPGGTHALAGEFAGTHDFEVIAYVVILAAGAE
jgi:hypothetical protein